MSSSAIPPPPSGPSGPSGGSPDLDGLAIGLGTRLRAALMDLGAAEDADVPLADGALHLAACAHPGAALEPFHEHLGALAATVEETAARSEDSDSAEGRASVLRAVLVERWHYVGDVEAIEDVDNADLMRVIDRRRGLSVSLGILWLHAARAQGWAAHGLNFPGHFLLRLDGADGDRVILDPFHGGRTVDAADLRALLKALNGPAAELTPDMHGALSNRDILLRLHNTTKMRYLDAGHVDRALGAVEQMLLIAPTDHRLWREAGLMHMRLGALEPALERLDTYLALAPPGTDRDRIADVLHELRSRMT